MWALGVRELLECSLISVSWIMVCGIRLGLSMVRRGLRTFLEVIIHLDGTIARSFTVSSGSYPFNERNNR